ncbi:MAG: HAMP domain-containing sensor histidine kinase [Synergistes sp.]|nr:HAMP domain-containing sensor histidine kinase [Synergistes sp.]
MKVKRSLRTQLIFQYMVIVIVCMIVIPAAISKLLDMQFRRFASERLQENEIEIAEYFVRVYLEYGTWRESRLFPENNDFIRWPMFKVELFDNDGRSVRMYNRMESTSRRSSSLELSGRRPNTGSHSLHTHGDTVPARDIMIERRELYVEGIRIGEIHFSILPFSFSPEGRFLTKFNKIMYYAVAAMLAVAVLIAVFMAHRISRPVLNTANMARQISRGEYEKSEKTDTDITELAVLVDSVDRLGESLKEQENLRRRLLSDIAHELRNPVTIIKSHLEAIEDGVWQPTPERIRLTVGEIDRLSSLIREVEKLTSIESAAHCITFENIDISQTAERAAMAFDPMYAAKGVLLKRSIEDKIFAEVDGAKIRQVVENLLSNALRYTDEGGSVTFTAANTGNSFTIKVKDTGIGIAPKDLPYVFERFYRTDLSRTRTSGGIGIGLAIVKAIVEAHNGTIRAESELGKGSTFTVEIPLKIKEKGAYLS